MTFHPFRVAAILVPVLAAALLFAAPAQASAATSTSVISTSAAHKAPASGYAKLHGSRKAVCPEESCGGPSAGNRISGSFRLSGSVADNQQVCFYMEFRRDLVDPQEGADITIVDSSGSVGFTNVGTAAVSKRTVCFGSANYPGGVQQINDGRRSFVVYASHGSFVLKRVRVTVTAVSTLL